MKMQIKLKIIKNYIINKNEYGKKMKIKINNNQY